MAINPVTGKPYAAGSFDPKTGARRPPKPPTRPSRPSSGPKPPSGTGSVRQPSPRSEPRPTRRTSPRPTGSSEPGTRPYGNTTPRPTSTRGARMPGDRGFGTSAGSQSGQTRPPSPTDNRRREVRREVREGIEAIARSLSPTINTTRAGLRQTSPYTSLKDTKVTGGSLIDQRLDGNGEDGTGLERLGIGGFDVRRFNQGAVEGETPLGGPISGGISTIFRKLDAPAYPAGSALLSKSPAEILPNIGKGIAAWQAEWGKTPGLDRFAPAAPFFKDNGPQDPNAPLQPGAVLPSQAIRQRGWDNALRIPGKVDDIGVGILADTAGNPTSYLSFGTGSGARAASAATSASISTRGLVTRAARQLGPDDLASTRATVSGAAQAATKAGRQARQSRGVRWNRGQGPDIIVAPTPARATSATGKIPPARGRRTRVEDLPYAPTGKAQRALDKSREAEALEVTRPVDPRTAANAGARAARASASRGYVEKTLRQRQRAQAAAADALPAARSRVKELSDELGELRADKTASPVRIETTARRLAQAEQARDKLVATVAAARKPLGSPLPKPARAPKPGEVAVAALTVKESRLANGGVRVAGQGGSFNVQRTRLANGRVGWTISSNDGAAVPRRAFPTREAAVIDARNRAGTPSTPVDVAAPQRNTVRPFSSGTYTPVKARQLAGARDRVRQLESQVASLRRQGASTGQISQVSQRLGAARSNLRRLEAQARPRGGVYTDARGARRLTRAREAERQAIAQRNEVVGQRGTSTGQAVAIGVKRGRTRQRLREVEREVYGRPPRQKVGKGRGGRDPEKDWRKSWGDQPESIKPKSNTGNRNATTQTKPEMLIDAHMTVEEAAERGAREGARGIHVYLPGQRGRGTGSTIPIPGFGHGEVKSSLPSAGGARPAAAPLMSERSAFARLAQRWHRAMVSQYGPNKIAAEGARGADAWAMWGRNHAIETVGDLMKKHGIKTAEQQRMATYLAEALDQPKAREFFIKEFGIRPENAPANVRAFVDDGLAYTDSLFGEYVQAGGDIKRLNRNYVFHAYRASDVEDLIENRASALTRTIDKYGNEPGYAKRRGYMSLAEAKEAGLDPVENFAELLILRATAHHRSIADLGLINITRRRYGQRGASLLGDGVEQVGKGEYRAVKGSRWSRLSDYSGLAKDEDVFIPTDVAMTLMNAERARLAIQKMPAKWLRDINRHMKFMQLFSSGYQIRNQISDMVRDFQRGGDPFSTIRHGVQMMGRRGRDARGAHGDARRMSDLLGVTNAGHVAAELTDEVGQQSIRQRIGRSVGVKQTGGRELTGHSRLRRATLGNYRKLSTGRENLMRAGRFAKDEKRVGPIMAAKRNRGTFYDYGDVGSYVDIMRRYPIAPFVTWPVKNIPGQVKSLASNPGRAIAMASAYRNAQAEFGMPDPWDLPEWFRSRMPIATPWGYVGFDNPAADLNNVVPGNGRSLKEVAESWTGQGSPILQAPQVIGGTNPLTGIPFRERQPSTPYDEALLQIPGMDKILGPDYTLMKDAQGREESVPSVRGIPQWFLQQMFPIGGTVSRAGGLERIAPGTANSDDRGLLNPAVIGVRRMDPYDVEYIDSAIRRREYERQRLTTELNKTRKARQKKGERTDNIPEIAKIKRIDEDIKSLMARRAYAVRRKRGKR